jgi:CHASE1-domain containing sensor protein
MCLVLGHHHLIVNEATLKSMAIADQLKLSQSLIESVANALFGEQDSDDESYECVDDEDD